MAKRVSFVGTLGSDMAAMVQLFARGADYASTNDFGVTLWANLTFTIGRLDMTNDQITSNVREFLSSLAPQKNQPEFGKLQYYSSISNRTFFRHISSWFWLINFAF